MTFLAYKVLNSNGYGNSSDVISAIENATLSGANVMSLSLGGGGYADDAYATPINNAVAAGIVVVVAAGNSGYYGYGTIGSPGTILSAITG